jgi:hypothetical protein
MAPGLPVEKLFTAATHVIRLFGAFWVPKRRALGLSDLAIAAIGFFLNPTNPP